MDYLEHNCYGDTLKALRLEMTRRGEVDVAAAAGSQTTEDTNSHRATRKGKERATDRISHGLDATTPMDIVESEDDRDPLMLAIRARTSPVSVTVDLVSPIKFTWIFSRNSLFHYLWRYLPRHWPHTNTLPSCARHLAHCAPSTRLGFFA